MIIRLKLKYFSEEVGRFFVAMAKIGKNSVNFLNSLIDWSILSIQCIQMNRWPSVREGFNDQLSIISIKNKKIFNRWIDNIDENETKSIDRYHRYWSIVECTHLCRYAHGAFNQSLISVGGCRRTCEKDCYGPFKHKKEWSLEVRRLLFSVRVTSKSSCPCRSV